jgi:cephalosporin hydroxylase
MKVLTELEEMCKTVIIQAGIDDRTSYLAGIIQSGESIVHRLQDLTRLESHEIRCILNDLVSERYADYYERRASGYNCACQPINLLLSQGYKRGLAWRGVPLGKTCWDIGIYQQLIQELRPRMIIEFGTGLGGSTLFFHDHCKMFTPDTKIVTIDINSSDVDSQVLRERSIKFIEGDAKDVDELLPTEELSEFPHPWLIVEDCHRQVPLIVRHLQPLMASGDYLVIEDLGLSAPGSLEIHRAIRDLPSKTFMVDTFYTDMFGRNLTCAPDCIFRKM